MKEKIYIWIAWHLPRRLVLWCTVRVGDYAAKQGDDFTNLTFLNVIKRWNK